jgi:hypothetical protein
MKNDMTYLGFLFILVFLIGNCSEKNDSPVLKGSYLGQKPPGDKPELFAPGIISTGFHEHSFPSFSPAGDEVLWTTGMISNYIFKFPIKILSIKMKNGIWSDPEFAGLSSCSESFEAFFSPDGQTVFFSSTHSEDPDVENNKLDIWYVKKTESSWSEPENLGPPVNTENHENQATVAQDLTLYYVGYLEGVKNNYGIYRSEYVDGKYGEPELLPDFINSKEVDWTPFISQDESYLLFSSLRDGGYGSGDIYVSFRKEDNSWTKAQNLGPEINDRFNERYPYVSPDGKYLFFVSDKLNEKLEKDTGLKFTEYKELYQNPGNGLSDIYWVSAKIIEDLKPDELK